MSETERQIEKEALASTWACEQFSTYVLGKNFMTEMDHKPLVSLLGSKHLDGLPPRILRFSLRLTQFDYNIEHVPGKQLYTADTLSRSPLPHTGDKVLKELTEAPIHSCVAKPVSEGRLMTYQDAQKSDALCALVMEYRRT